MSKPHHLLRIHPLSPIHQWSFSQIRLFQGLVWFFTTICRHSRTLLLFTYTDYKTIFIPVTIFAAVTAPVHSPHHFFRALLWIWLHLLQCNVSNQYKTCQEDMINRPWRPIPSGRVTLTEAFRLRLLLIPLCLGISSIYGWDVVATSAGLTTTMLIYDEVGLAGHWVGKNLCNVFGYLTFEIGATKIMGQTQWLDDIAQQALLYSACVILTTIQAQDFSDVVGDAQIGRVTFPIYAPSFSRVFTLFVIVLWSAILSMQWSLGVYWQIVFCSLGAYVGWRYYRLRTSAQDSRSYLLFNIWLFVVHLLPSRARWGILTS